MNPQVIQGRYQLLRAIGAGGMGEVWLAADASTGGECAVKLLSRYGGTESTLRQRFVREAQILSRLRHPNLVAVYDSGMEGERLYLVMDYVNGSDLASLVQSGGPLPAQDAVALILDVLEGLAFAHDHNVIHRDVKPHNIMVGADGRARVGDFGIARVLEADDGTFTRSGAFLGSPSYMAPEQREDARHVGVQADIYGVGGTLHFLLTGNAGAQLHVREVQEEVARTVPAPLASTILRSTRYRPADRYSSAREMSDAVRSAAAALAKEGPGASSWRPPGASLSQTWDPSLSQEHHTALPRGVPLGAVPPSEATTTQSATTWPPQDARSPILLGVVVGLILGLVGTGAYLMAEPWSEVGPSPELAPAPAPPAVEAQATSSSAPSRGRPVVTGLLTVEVRPSGTVALDGTSPRPSPVDLHLAEGTHATQLVGPTGESVTLTVRVQADQPQKVCWDFTSDRPC